MRPAKTSQTFPWRLLPIIPLLVMCAAAPAAQNAPGAGPTPSYFTGLFEETSPIFSLAAPGNDNFADAILLAGESGQAMGSNIGATSESGEPIHAGVGAGVSVWWRWVAPADGRWSFDTAGSDFDTVLAVYSGASLTSLAQEAANDDGGPNATSKVIFAASAGTTYSIAVDGYYLFDTGSIVLNWSPAPQAPPNDNFADAIAISGESGQITGTNEGALKEPGEPDHAGVPGGASVWWKWTAPSGGFITLNTHGSKNPSGGQLDTLLAVYTGTRVDDLTPVASNDDANRSQGVYTSLVNFPVQENVTYHIAVDGYAQEFGNIALNWVFVPQVPAEIRGSLWEDVDGNGLRDPGEPPLPGWIVYLDQNGNNEMDPGEIFTVTDENGDYVFAGLDAGTYLVAQEVEEGWRQTFPSVGPSVASRQAALAAAGRITTTASKAPIFTHEKPVTKQDWAIIPSTAQSGPLINLNAFRNDPRFAGINGSGYAVAILDTGIDLNHPFFGPDIDGNGVADRIIFQYDFADDDDDASDRDGHGSNVAGIAASQDSTWTGMAPEAGIVVLKVFRDQGNGDFGLVEKALQWLVQNAPAYNVVAVNMSLGDAGNYNQPTQMYGIADELAALAALNVIVVSSAGNNYLEFLGEPGVSYPAADPNSLAVGAVYDANIGGVIYGGGAMASSTGPDRITPFSQRHPTLLSIFAPGAAITNANAFGALATMHGTSQASPHIAGIAALAQQLADQALGHRLTPAQFASLLRASGTVINDGDDEDDNVIHSGLDYPRVDVLALGQAISALAGHGTHTITVAYGQVAEGIDFGNQGPAISLLITHYYLAALGRDPEPGAVAGWRNGYFQTALDLELNIALITKEMGRIFFDSEEYQNRQRTDAEFIADCYETFLLRTPSEGELAGWLAGIWERGEVIPIFADSQEHADLMSDLFPGCEGTPPRNFVAVVYSGLLDRLVEGGGLSYWQEQMDQALDKNQEAVRLIRTILESEEFLSHGHNSAQVVSRLYWAFFGRFGRQDEVAYWAGELDSGRRTLNNVVDAFAASPEFADTLARYFGP